jgi:two-component system sensor histidine kinase KdpD
MEKWRLQIQGCFVALALCAVITLVAMQWLVAFEAANLVMLYLLGVVIIALLYGRWPSVLATVINVVSFDLFFVSPRGTLAVSDVQYLLTFGVMLTVGLLIGNLTAGVAIRPAWRAIVSSAPAICMRCQKRWRSGAEDDIAATSERFIASTFQARGQLLLPDSSGKLHPLTHQPG